MSTDDQALAGHPISPNELRRRLIHMTPGLLPFVLWRIPHRDPVSPTMQAIIAVIIGILSVVAYVRFDRIARQGNMRERLGAVAGFGGSVLAMILIFPAHLELAMTVLAVLAFGDGSATLGGLLIGGPRLPWNATKTWSGLACFLVFGTLAATLCYWGETHFNPEATGAPVSFATALVCGGSATVAAAIAESLPSGITDNILVGLTAAVVVTIAHALTVGL